MDLSRLLSFDELTVIAHRGGSRLRPENTVASFDHAVTLGVDALECDVHVSADGEPVVIHDATLDRTTDATGPVAARRADELAQVDAGFQFGAGEGHPYRGRGYGVPRLSVLLDRYRALPVIIEIKGDRPEVAERALAVVREAGALDRVIFGGFSQAVLETLRRLAPDVPTSASRDEIQGILQGGGGWRPAAAPGYRLVQAPFRFEGRQVFGPDFVRAVRAAGYAVQAWIVDEPDDMSRLIDWGVTGIISDRPDVAIHVVRHILKSGNA